MEKLSFKTENDAVEGTKEKAIWIVQPEDPKGALDQKVYPIPGSNRLVVITETPPCPICSGEDHRLGNCKWKTEGIVDTWWGTNSRAGPSKKKIETKTLDVPAPVPEPEVETIEDEQAAPVVEGSDVDSQDDEEEEESSDETADADATATATATATD